MVAGSIALVPGLGFSFPATASATPGALGKEVVPHWLHDRKVNNEKASSSQLWVAPKAGWIVMIDDSINRPKATLKGTNQVLCLTGPPLYSFEIIGNW